MSTFANGVGSLAVDVGFPEDAWRVVLADGRAVSAPLQWFRRLLNATAQHANWQLIGDPAVASIRSSDRPQTARAERRIR